MVSDFSREEIFAGLGMEENRKKCVIYRSYIYFQNFVKYLANELSNDAQIEFKTREPQIWSHFVQKNGIILATGGPIYFNFFLNESSQWAEYFCGSLILRSWRGVANFAKISSSQIFPLLQYKLHTDIT